MKRIVSLLEFLGKLLTVKAGTHFGIPLIFHWSWTMMMILIAESCYRHGNPTEMFVVLSIYLFVVLHEYGHSITAKRMDIPVENITIYPFGGVAAVHMPPNEPHKEFWVTLMGPAVNFFLIPVFFIFAVLFPDSSAATMCAINTGLLLFNMLPVFPMDGGRVFRSLLCKVVDYKVATRIAVRVSHVMCVGIFAGAIYYGHPMLIVIMPLIFLAAAAELGRVENFEKHQKYIAILNLIKDGKDDEAMTGIASLPESDENMKKRLTGSIIILRDLGRERADELLEVAQLGIGSALERAINRLELEFVRKQSADLDKLITAIDEGQPLEQIEELIHGMKDGDFRENCLKVLAQAKQLRGSP
jgi:Zn-dependent protease